MSAERKPRAIIFFKHNDDFVIFSDPEVEVMIAYAEADGLLHETQHPIPEWLMNDATVIVEGEGAEPPNGPFDERSCQVEHFKDWSNEETTFVEQAVPRRPLSASRLH